MFAALRNAAPERAALLDCRLVWGNPWGNGRRLRVRVRLGVHVVALQQTAMAEPTKVNPVAGPCGCSFFNFLLMVPEALDDTLDIYSRSDPEYDTVSASAPALGGSIEVACIIQHQD